MQAGDNTGAFSLPSRPLPDDRSHPGLMRRGETCPRCGLGTLDYNGLLDLEPHLKGGGQFGGFSGPDGMGVALRALCRVLDYVRIGYHLRDFDDIKAARGF